MTRDEEELPFDIRMVTPGTPEYAEGEAIHLAAQRNLDYFLKHESQLIEQFPGPCLLLVYNGNQVRGCADIPEMLALLDTLDVVERSAALEFPQPAPGTAWAL